MRSGVMSGGDVGAKIQAAISITEKLVARRVVFDDVLRQRVDSFAGMHELFDLGYTPRAEQGKTVRFALLLMYVF